MATVSDPSAPAGVVEPVVPAGASPADGGADLAVAGWQAAGDAESKSDRYLARRLAAASADFKGVALTTFVLGAAVCGGAWLLLGILVEHWLVPGGSPAAEIDHETGVHCRGPEKPRGKHSLRATIE